MEKTAQLKQKGLWRSNESIPPWKWKRMKHGS
jgi:hypothetical protein